MQSQQLAHIAIFGSCTKSFSLCCNQLVVSFLFPISSVPHVFILSLSPFSFSLLPPPPPPLFPCTHQIQWLLENYETAEGVSLPRSTLYNHYLRHCAANKIDAVNAASFGKLIRSVFIGLKTRRLGTRYVSVCMCVCVHELQVPVCLVILCV